MLQDDVDAWCGIRDPIGLVCNILFIFKRVVIVLIVISRLCSLSGRKPELAVIRCRVTRYIMQKAPRLELFVGPQTGRSWPVVIEVRFSVRRDFLGRS